MKLKFSILFLFVAILSSCHKADLTPDTAPGFSPANPNTSFYIGSVLQSNMVVQRDKPFKIWGGAKVSSTVTVTVSWQDAPVAFTTNTSGLWEGTVPAAAANASPQTMTVKTTGEQAIELKNILIGDVWISSGQSNMNMPLGAISPFQGVENYQAEIAAANYPLIRFLKVEENYQHNPLTELTHLEKWLTCTPSTAENMSAASYYFARKLHTELNVPIGIVNSSINGSWCESWTDKSSLTSDATLNNEFSNSNFSSQLYNGMIHPLTKLSIKGFIWYQGENNQNISPPSLYTRLNNALIKGWRTIFDQGNLPFYYVQVTPFDYSATGNTELNNYAKFREAQAQIRATTPASGMAITLDAGQLDNHHSMYKKPVGERLALLALNKTYGLDRQCTGPQYLSFTQSGNQLTINFVSGTANGLNTLNGAPLKQYFFVAGSNGTFRLANGVISGDKIILTIPQTVSLPVAAVRYAFTNFPITNLQNSAGLPMEPFRTDNWDN